MYFNEDKVVIEQNILCRIQFGFESCEFGN